MQETEPLTADGDSRGDDLRDVARAAARCFGTDDGRKLLAHLRAITIERVCGPQVSDPALARPRRAAPPGPPALRPDRPRPTRRLIFFP